MITKMVMMVSQFITSNALGNGALIGKIENPQPTTSDYFGRAVTISGNGKIVAIGNMSDDPSGISGAGTVSIYTVSDDNIIALEATLMASDAAPVDVFGMAVSLSDDGNTLAVFAQLEDSKAGDAGSIYIFVRSGTTWTQQAHFWASEAGYMDGFASNKNLVLSGDGNTLVYGSPNRLAAFTSPKVINIAGNGKVFIFVRSGTTWTQQAILVERGSDNSINYYFGNSVDATYDGNTIVIGAIGDDTQASNAGAVYVYTRSGVTWTREAMLLPDAVASASMGNAVGINKLGNRIVCGGSHIMNSNTFIFDKSGTVWSRSGIIPPLPAQVGTGVSLHQGQAVGISEDGNIIALGTSKPDSLSLTGGVNVFVYVNGDWYFSVQIKPFDGAPTDYFAYSSLGLSGDGKRLIVGAHGEEPTATPYDVGAAYLYNISA